MTKPQTQDTEYIETVLSRTLIGYMRVSTDDQDVEMQRQALDRAGVLAGDIYSDHITGAKVVRPGLDAALARLQAGDTLVVWKLDRLGRQVRHLYNLVLGLQERGIGFKSVTESFDTTTAMGKAMFGMLCVFAEMERDNIKLRVKTGMAVKKAQGVRMGRPVVPFYDHAAARRDIKGGMVLEEACGKHGFSMSTARRLRRSA